MMDVDYSAEEFKKKLFLLDEIVHNTKTSENYIPGADRYRSSVDKPMYGIYKDAIDCNEVFPNIIVGNKYAAKEKKFLKAINVTHVLNCASQLSHFNQDYYSDSKIKVKNLPLEDIYTEDITRYFDESFIFIDEAIRSGGKVLINCLAGISRSSTIAIAYLMKTHKMPVDNALKLVKENRMIFPNEGFLKQLVKYDFKLQRDNERNESQK